MFNDWMLMIGIDIIVGIKNFPNIYRLLLDADDWLIAYLNQMVLLLDVDWWQVLGA